MRPLSTLTAALAGLLLLAAPASAQSTTATIPNVISNNLVLDANQVYLLDGETYVEAGASITIPAGTIIKGALTPSAGKGQASVLVIQRGGQILANGTADAPVIFTSDRDNVADPFDLSESSRGLWGGVVVLGNATNNRGERTIEGIPATARTTYGPTAAGGAFPLDDDDNSGVMRYVSIRHAGFTLTADAEINGLTLGAVGRGTTLEYIEVFANSDDSFEFFGGTVNAKYLVGAFSGDDDIDWDTGYTGKLQYVFSIKDQSGDVGRCIEGDGSASPFTATPMSSPVVSNLTCVGSGLGSSPGGSDAGGPTFALRDNTGGFIYNSVLTQFQTDRGGIDLEPAADVPNPDATTSTQQNFFDGELDIRNNIFFDFSVGNTAAAIVRRDNAQLEAEIDARNRFVSPGLVYVLDGPNAGDDARDQDGVLDPRPGSSAAAASGAAFNVGKLSGDTFFDTVDYLGAFAPAPAPVWTRGWTAMSSALYFSEASERATPNELGPVADGFSLSVGPNPTRGDATVRFSLTEAQNVDIALYDVTGRRVAQVSGTFPAGPGAVALPTAGLAPGVYVMRFDGPDGRVSQTVSVVR